MAYRVIAPYYDWIMSHVDYDGWSRYLKRLLSKHNLEPKQVLEMAAGTCPFKGRNLFGKNIRVTYADLSHYMLKHSLPDAGETNGNRDRVAANALALPVKPGYQLCLMMYDSINYLMTAGDVLAVFQEMNRVLDPGGLFIFDVTTEANSKIHFDRDLYFDECAGCAYIRESKYDDGKKIQHNDFTFFVRGTDGRYDRFQENHAQRIYETEQMKALADRAGFQTVGCYDNFSFHDAKIKSQRIHFVLRKN